MQKVTLLALCGLSAVSALVYNPMRVPTSQAQPRMSSSMSQMRMSSSLSQPRKETMEVLLQRFLMLPTASRPYGEMKEATSVTLAIRRLQKDLNMLDERIGREPQLARSEISILILSSLTAVMSPLLFSVKVTEVLVPALAALAAAIGVSSEYTGRVAVAQGKEVAAATLQVAAEAEQILSRSERVKAVMPFCVGISAGCGVISLLAPEIIEEVLLKTGITLGLFSDVFVLFWPFVSVATAAVAALAAQECSFLARRAAGVGARRMATSKTIARTWLSAPEQVTLATTSMRRKWTSFVKSILLAPVLGVLVPGTLATKCVLVSVVAAAQCAYYLTTAEYDIANAIDKVAEKLRSASLAEVYANQGARAGSILPFTSALGALCVAAAAAVAELQPTLGVIFPALGAVFAGAASVSKAQTEIDTAAACAAATELAESNRNEDEQSDPIKSTLRNIRLAFAATYKRYVTGIIGIRRKIINRFFRNYRPVTKSSVENLENAYRMSPDAHVGDKSKKESDQKGNDVPKIPGVVYDTP